ncbi:hypothetical protein AB205_0153820 [Aquarana catesbeiana]|uniref:Uncharacterized protein n=2 Tax=Aquarana catesbeiana TaxID=8400 RepID=A0A2G9RIS3_AQUCT|nr:hypothetical protein AB205_0153820 [Aquarana catesbeiana]
MSFEEMVEMVDILKRTDYDGNHGLYRNPNVRKAKIMTKVVRREKKIMTSEDTRNPTPPEEGELSTQPDDLDAEVEEVVGMVTTTGDMDVVEEETRFNRASAQVLISEIMVCNRDLEKVKQNINDVQKRLTNIIDVLAKI